VRLTITTPLATILCAQGVRRVRAEDASGAFGILAGHADLLTVLTASVVSFCDAQEREHYVAVRGGMLRVTGGEEILVATPEAITGDDLQALETEVLAGFHRALDAQRAVRTDAERLRLAAIRQIMRLLRADGRRGPGPIDRVERSARASSQS
jgi:F-type H+-transporting ATPase subunit epsilon